MSRLVPFVLIGAALAGWEIAARSGMWSPLLLPSLANIGYEFGLFFSRTDRLLEAWTSLHRALGTTTRQKTCHSVAPRLSADQTRIFGVDFAP